ncbi:Gfo/Idh/MocA family protein [Paenibacillus sp. 1P07SE]|uniref:Gfo/Idh/MocA family protein n=1 Tax=Paenibacillus sp. 1P07SE TaxID=3132209 RepID=UPI0039A5F5B9
MSFKIAVIGCGAFSVLMHGPAYVQYAAERDGVTLAACCDLDEDKAASFRTAFGFGAHYTNYLTMLQEEQPDAVCLHVSIPSTSRLAIAILELGYPLLMEKPPGVHPEDTLAIMDAAARSGTVAKVAMNRRYMPLMMQLKSMLDEQSVIHPVRHIAMEMVRYRRHYDFTTTAIHCIDAIRYLAGADYDRIQFHYTELPEDSDHAVNVSMLAVMRNGTTAQLMILPTAGATIERASVHLRNVSYYLRLPLTGSVDEEGELLAFESKKVSARFTNTDYPGEAEPYQTNGFYREIAAFLDGIASGEPVGVEVADVLQSVVVAACMRRREPEYNADLTVVQQGEG